MIDASINSENISAKLSNSVPIIVPYGDHGDYKKVYVLKKTQPILTESLAIKRRISHLESEIKYEQGKLKTAKAKELEYIRRQEKGLEQ